MSCALLVIILKFVQEQTGTAAVSLLGKMKLRKWSYCVVIVLFLIIFFISSCWVMKVKRRVIHHHILSPNACFVLCSTPVIWSVNAGPCFLFKLSAALVHVRQTVWLKFSHPPHLVQPVMQVCSNSGFIHLMKSWAAAEQGVSPDKRIWVSTIQLLASGITMSLFKVQ